jgi:hypothetical protein
MAVQWSATVRNAVLDAWETAIGTSAVIKIWTGTQPANTGSSDSGTLLATFSLGSDWAQAASSSSKILANLAVSTTAVATNTAGHYRIYASNGTTCHEQGSITATGGGGDIEIDSTSITSGQTVRITAFTKTAPHA